MHSFFYYCFTAPESYKTAVISADLQKLDLFGVEYLFEFIKWCTHDRLYRIYITDTLKMIAENTAKFAGGSVPKSRYAEIIEPKPAEPEKSAEEIIAEVNARCGLTMTGGEIDECI